MENKFVSLIYPDKGAFDRHSAKELVPNITEDVSDELGLVEVFEMKSAEISDFFTRDTETIKYRQKTVRDLIAVPEVLRTLSQIHPILNDIRELRRLDDEQISSVDSYLYSISEIELYVSCIETLKKGLVNIEGRLESPACKTLASYIKELSESEYYVDLTKSLEKLSEHVSDVKSITVGVNLDREMRPESAAVLSVNSEKFKSGKTLDKILRLSFKNDAFTTIAELTPVVRGAGDNKKEALIGAFNSALEEVFHSSVRSWRNTVSLYVTENTDFLIRLLPEIEFVSRSAELIKKITSLGLPVCYPEVAPEDQKRFEAKGLYNPRVALYCGGDIVDNDFKFDDKAGIYILSGPNRGGKSVITVALGAAQAMCQLGLPVCAESAVISPVSGIFTHFPEGALDTIDKGRLGEECARLGEIFDECDDKSMILLDESLSSTGSYEASYIAAEILAAFACRRTRGIFSTHLHELAASVSEINERSSERGGVMIDTLVAGIEDGKRSFKIHRMKPDGRSYAKDIANKYGLSFDNLMKGR